MKYFKNLKIPSQKVIENKNYYCDNFALFDKINNTIEYVNKGGFYDRLSPKTLYKKIYNYELFTEDKWIDLRNLKYKKEDYIKLQIAVDIEYIKVKLSKYDKTRSYDYYDNLIDINNYKKYDIELYKYQLIEDAEYYIKNIEENGSYLSSEEYSEAKKHIQEFKDYKAIYSNVWDTDKLSHYKYKFRRLKDLISDRIEKEKEKEENNDDEDEDEERPRRNNNYSSSSSNYSNSSYNNSSSSRNNDMKKAYVSLCQNCKNSCVGCQRKIKNTEIGASKAFGLHNKCKGSSCYICGKSNSTVREKNSSYLCKSCYRSNKYDPTKCLSCKKSFK